jgi:hypothetical protein
LDCKLEGIIKEAVKMKTRLFLMVMGLMLVMFYYSSAQVPQMINYQGKLTSPSGAPVNDTVPMVFSIYSDEGGTNLLWTETQTTVIVDKGVFNVLLGSVNPIPDSVFNGSVRYLGVKVESDPEITPRKPMVSVPYAYRASSVGGGSDDKWKFRITDTADTSITTRGNWGIARYGATLYGDMDSTHVNLGVSCTTGISTHSNKYCTVAGGLANTASESATTVGGGYRNIASGFIATVAGGDSNIASNNFATVGGGHINSASNSYAFVGGGYFNTASGTSATVGGGEGNAASYGDATVGGGTGNVASGYAATVGGGSSNDASGPQTTVAGGSGNTASGNLASVGGGLLNTANSTNATVGGGYGDTASGVDATVGGGTINTASGSTATVGGGGHNTASGWSATVAGGYYNTASGDQSFAAGRRAKANHDGSFVWADHTDADFASTDTNQFLIRASGGVGIGTTSPNSLLELKGPIAKLTLNTTTSYAGMDIKKDGFAKWTVGWDAGSQYFYFYSYKTSPGTKLVIHDSTGNVGIQTTTPNTTADINGDIALRAGSFIAGNGNNNDISIGQRSFVRITGPTAAFTITGIAGGQDGKIVFLYNTTAQNMTIANESASSSAANRILTMSGANESTTTTGNVTLIYDATGQRWIVTAIKP